MAGLLSSAQKTALADALASDNESFDFATSSTPLAITNGFTATNADINNNSGTARFRNDGSSQGLITLPVTAVVGRSYVAGFDVTAGNSNIQVSVGDSAAFNSSAESGSKDDGTGYKTVAHVAGATTIYLALRLVSSVDDEYCDIDNLWIREEGTASGWTDADQQLDIPQTALQSYNQLAWFDGVADYVSIGDHNDFSVDAFSVSTWINMNDATDFPIFGKGAYNSNAEYQLKVQDDDKIYFWVADESVASCYIGRVSPTVTAYENKWIHVVGTYDGGTASTGLKIYINGAGISSCASLICYLNYQNALF